MTYENKILEKTLYNSTLFIKILPFTMIKTNIEATINMHIYLHNWNLFFIVLHRLLYQTKSSSTRKVVSSQNWARSMWPSRVVDISWAEALCSMDSNTLGDCLSFSSLLSSYQSFFSSSSIWHISEYCHTQNKRTNKIE